MENGEKKEVIWGIGGGKKSRKEEKRGFYHNWITTKVVEDKKCKPRLI
jgi:hypothetical protein